MKKSLLLLSMLAMTYGVTAQEDDDKVTSDPRTSYNRWSVDINAGQSQGIKPYAEGYFGSDPQSYFGGFDINHFGAGVRYMISPRFGVKLNLAYDRLQNLSGSGSLPFDVRQYQIGFEGVVNAVRLLSFEDRAGRFGLLLHGGIQVAQLSPKIGDNAGGNDYNGGVMFGVTPQLRLTKKLGIQADITMNSNIRQHINWDGSTSDLSNNLAGSMYTVSFGLNYSFGKEEIHGDWAIIADERLAEIDELDRRIGEIETMMNDSDKDGVPDYLDVENNSIAGVAVDSKGRMIDLNNNGVPDELEKYVNASINEKMASSAAGSSSEVVKRLINEGYIAVFFDFGSSKPTPSSTQNVAFILNYLRNNPSASADITGYADEIGNASYNNTLSSKRATSIKDTLVKAGISASRLNIIPAGEDTSVDKNSPEARKLVRKVIFMIK